MIVVLTVLKSSCISYAERTSSQVVMDDTARPSMRAHLPAKDCTMITGSYLPLFKQITK